MTFGLALLWALFSANGGPLDLTQVVARHVAARGGYDAWKAIETLVIEGRVETSSGPLTWLSVEYKRPGRLRVSHQVDGKTGLQIYDGRQGWLVDPYGHDPMPEAMDTRALAEMRRTADFEGPLIDSAAKGYRLIAAHRELVDDLAAIRLELRSQTGEVSSIYLDPDTWLERRRAVTMDVGGAPVTTWVDLSDYRLVGSLSLPYRMDVTFVDLELGYRLSIERVEVNRPIDDSRFTMPTR